MKEMDSLETQLRSWRPRRPAAGLKRRIFGGPARIFSKTTWILGSLAPAVACALITFSIINRENSGGPLRDESTTAMLSSNAGDAKSELASFRKGENSWSAVTFDWTNHGSFTSSIAPFPQESLR
jgi:hypothetical protein